MTTKFKSRKVTCESAQRWRQSNRQFPNAVRIDRAVGIEANLQRQANRMPFTTVVDGTTQALAYGEPTARVERSCLLGT